MVDLLSFGCVAHCGFYHSSRKVSPMSLYNIHSLKKFLTGTSNGVLNEMIDKIKCPAHVRGAHVGRGGIWPK